MAAAELVEYVAKSLVDDPEAVKVEVVRDGAGPSSSSTSPTTTWARSSGGTAASPRRSGRS